jgi:hypothetical protein
MFVMPFICRSETTQHADARPSVSAAVAAVVPSAFLILFPFSPLIHL